MSLITVTSGAYVGTYTRLGLAQSMGVTRGGYALSWTIHEDLWNRSVSFGNSIIEAIYAGADWEVSYSWREYSRGGALAAMWPWGSGPGQDELVVAGPGVTFPAYMGSVGRRSSEYGGSLILTAVSGTPAAGSPATFTAPYTTPAGGARSGFSFDSAVREGTTALRLIPFSTGAGSGLGGAKLGGQAWFRTT